MCFSEDREPITDNRFLIQLASWHLQFVYFGGRRIVDGQRGFISDQGLFAFDSRRSFPYFERNEKRASAETRSHLSFRGGKGGLLVCRDSTGKFFRTPGNYRVLQKPILPCQFLSECLFVFSLVLSSYRLLLFVAFDSSLTF